MPEPLSQILQTAAPGDAAKTNKLLPVVCIQRLRFSYDYLLLKQRLTDGY